MRIRTYVLQTFTRGRWRTVCDSPSRLCLEAQARWYSFPARVVLRWVHSL